MTVKDKLKVLKTEHKNQFNKYYRTMSYIIGAVEVDALYNILVLNVESEYEFTRRHEVNVREILKL